MRWVWSSIIFTLVLGTVAFRITVATTGGSIVWSDGVAYFIYARSITLDFDTDLTNEYQELDQRFPPDTSGHTNLMSSLRNWAQRDAVTGRVSLPWPPGAGLVMVPFYLVGYAIEWVTAGVRSRPIDSFGLIPQLAYCAGSLVYGLIGFWATFFCCRRVASQNVALLSTLFVVFAGPLLFYIFLNPSMSHAAAFCFTSLLVLLWLRNWEQGVTFRSSWLLGLALGLLMIVRYQNVLFGILPVALYLREIWRNPRRNLPYAAIALIGSALPLVIMLLHNHYFGISKTNPPLLENGIVALGQFRFDLRSPFFFQVLTSCKQGAFYWAPGLGIAFVGLIWTAYKTSYGKVFLAVFLVHVFLIGGITAESAQESPGDANAGHHQAQSASDAPAAQQPDWNKQWRGGNMFGMRYLAECGTLLSVGLAVLIAATGSVISTYAWFGLSALFALANGLLMLAYGLGTISRSFCVTHGEMVEGVIHAMQRLLH